MAMRTSRIQKFATTQSNNAEANTHHYSGEYLGVTTGDFELRYVSQMLMEYNINNLVKSVGIISHDKD